MLLSTRHQEVEKKVRAEEMRLVEVNFSLQTLLADHKKSEEERKQLETEYLQLKDVILPLEEKVKILEDYWHCVVDLNLFGECSFAVI